MRRLYWALIFFTCFQFLPAMAKVIGQNDMKPIAQLAHNDVYSRLSRPIGRLTIELGNKKLSFCTASLIASDLVLTAYHCARKGENIKNMSLLMGYRRAGKKEEARRYKVVSTPVESDKEAGYAILRVAGDPGDKWGMVRLSSLFPAPGTSLFMLHHPLGNAVHLSLCQTARPAHSKTELFHLCDSVGGSAGAPIFDENKRSVIAIHSGADGQKNFGQLIATIAQNSSIIAQKLMQDTVTADAPRIAKARRKLESASFTESQDYTTVKVFYGTDRQHTGTPSVTKYGSARSSSGINYGSCEVTIPKTHKVGMIELPKWWKVWSSPDPKKHITLKNVKWRKKDDFFTDFKAVMAQSPKKKAFIFVHGYNVDFKEAALRTGQMAYDLGFQGAPVFYSWPSQGAYWGYPMDAANIKWSKNNLKIFLADFMDKSDAEEIYIIAHSMGNRGLARAVSELVIEKPQYKKRFKEIILAAPDIDADIFKDEIAPHIISAAEHVTLYASDDDIALKISAQFNGGYPRAGQAGENLVLVNNIETIDATGVGMGWIAHDYIGSAASILADLKAIFRYGKRPDERKTVTQETGKSYWTIIKEFAGVGTKTVTP